MQNHNISVRGGNANTKYSVSGSYFGQDGIFINTGFRRWQGRVTLDQVINKKLSFGINANYSDTKNYGYVAANSLSSAAIMYSIWAYRPIFPEDINLDYDLMDPSINPATDYRTNPKMLLENEFRENFSNGLMANGYLDYSINKDLRLRISGGMSKNNNQDNLFRNSKSPSGNPSSPGYVGVNGTESISNSVSYSNENTITWNKKIMNSHNLSVVGGFSQQMGRSNSFGARVVMITNEN